MAKAKKKRKGAAKKKVVKKRSSAARKPVSCEAPAVPDEARPPQTAAAAETPAAPAGPCCQSCGAPLDAEEKFGKNADGSTNSDYCVFCFNNGAFRDPQMTLDRMVEFVAGAMSQKTGIGIEAAKIQASTLLPTLKRWCQ